MYLLSSKDSRQGGVAEALHEAALGSEAADGKDVCDSGLHSVCVVEAVIVVCDCVCLQRV